MRTSSEYTIDVGNVELAVVEWPGDSDPVLLLHATGFHSRCWNEVVRRLPGQQVYAVDLRFHGRSGHDVECSKSHWQLMAEDICILIEQLGLDNLVGTGHSIGGYLITRAAAALGERFKQLVLIDPVILSPETYAGLRRFAGKVAALQHPVSRRKNRWVDADEMFNRFRDKAPFNTWQPGVLRDYCNHALRPGPESGVMRLACDPIDEASIYLSQSGNEVIFEDLSGLRTPVTLLRAPPGDGTTNDMSASPTWPGLAAALPRCREIYLPALNHYIPMQDPALVARYIEEAQLNAWQRGR